MCKVGATGVVGLTGAVGACGAVDRIVAQMAVTRNIVTVQSVPSHVGVQGKEWADVGAAKGAGWAFCAVLHDREVRDMWSDLGFEEMDEYSKDNLSGESQDGTTLDSNYLADRRGVEGAELSLLRRATQLQLVWGIATSLLWYSQPTF